MDFSAVAIALGPAPVLVFLLAVIIDALLGGTTRRLPLLLRPVELGDRLARELERRLNREFRSTAMRLIRGLILLLMVGVPAAIAGIIVERAANTLPFLWVLELAIVVALIAPRTPLDDTRAAARAIAVADLAEARIATQPMLDDGAARMDRLELSAALLRQLAERINSEFVAAAFWFVLLGVAGLAVYRVASIAAMRVTSDSEPDQIFSFAASRFHEAIAIIPAFFTGFLVVVASAFVPQARVGPAFAGALQWPVDRPASRTWPGSVFTRALDVAAAGAVDAGQTATLLNRAAYLYALSVGLGFALLALATLLRLSS